MARKLSVKKVAKKMIGMTESEAEGLAVTHGYRMRVVQRDGEHYILTMELRADRINVRIMKGLVTETYVG